MKGAIGFTLAGGGVLLLILLFSGQLKFPLGQVNILGSTLGDALSNILGSSDTPASLKQGVNPSPTTGTTGGVKNINPTVINKQGQKVVCPVGMTYDPASGKCVNVYQGNR